MPLGSAGSKQQVEIPPVEKQCARGEAGSNGDFGGTDGQLFSLCIHPFALVSLIPQTPSIAESGL